MASDECVALRAVAHAMCLILFAYQPHAQRRLVVAANRDEFFARPTLGAHWWDGGPDHRGRGIYGGRDLEAQGAWLAVSAEGRMAAVTNWTEDRNAPKAPGSRGDLAYRFLSADVAAGDFVAAIDGSLYAGFNFIAYDGEELVYTSNRTGEVRVLEAGVYGLTNTRLGPALAIDGELRKDTPHPRCPRRVAQGRLRRRGVAEDRQYRWRGRLARLAQAIAGAVGDAGGPRTSA